jgi:hypothetical protein
MVNTALLLTNPNFLNIKSSLKHYLQGQDQYKDFDFEGSNFNVILDVLAYNTYQSAFLDNMVASEMFLDTATLASSVISRAKELGYTGRSMRSAQSQLSIEITPTDTPGTIIVPAGYAFSSSIGSQAFIFLTTSAVVVVNNNGTYIGDVNIKEGFQVQETFVVSGVDTQKFLLSNFNVDTTTIQVYISNGGAETLYTAVDSIIEVTNKSLIYFIEQDYSGAYQLIFGDNNIGAALPTNTTIRVVYQVSSGELANGCTTFTPTGTIAGYSTIVVNTNTVASGGSAPESINSIKRNAPMLYQTKNRAVTDRDYEVILQDAFPEITSIHAYGGEKNIPPQYGKVIIGVVIAGIQGIPQTKVEQFTNFLTSRNSTIVTPVFITPTYVWIKVNSTVFYDYTQTALSKGYIESAVINKIQNYNSTYLNAFDTTFRSSKFSTEIDNADASINSNDTEILLAASISLDELSQVSQVINYENELDSTFPNVVTSNFFSYQGKVCSLISSDGIVYVQTNTNNTVGLLSQVGTIDYLTGIITLTVFQIDSVVGTSLNVYVKPLNTDLTVKLNNVLAIDFSQLSVIAVPELR